MTIVEILDLDHMSATRPDGRGGAYRLHVSRIGQAIMFEHTNGLGLWEPTSPWKYLVRAKDWSPEVTEPGRRAA